MRHGHIGTTLIVLLVLQAPLLCGCCCFPGSAISSPSGAAARSSFPPASWPCLADTSFYTWQRGSSASSDIGDAYKSKPGTTHLGHSTVTAMEILPLRILQTILLTFTASRLYVRYLALHPALPAAPEKTMVCTLMDLKQCSDAATGHLENNIAAASRRMPAAVSPTCGWLSQV
ncbi:hypothetical protein V5799_017904 [Amblyomma americanum]|uniref:Secreted protein n=1 Tax=Amblyomma americanum TaxID=6943 RepID=A0AAQ4F0S6_AMBAM